MLNIFVGTWQALFSSQRNHLQVPGSRVPIDLELLWYSRDSESVFLVLTPFLTVISPNVLHWHTQIIHNAFFQFYLDAIRSRTLDMRLIYFTVPGLKLTAA
jgi:hypothetical protein